MKIVRGISKEESSALQGLAILLMMYHHFFNDLSIYQNRLVFASEIWTLRVAWFGKICVGLFAFVSGYGMCRVLRRGAGSGFFECCRMDWKLCLRQAGKLLIRYWAVSLGFVSAFFLLGKREFILRELLENLFCLRYTYNGANWYVGQYVKMLLALPLLDLLLLRQEDGRERRKKALFYAGILLLTVVGGAALWCSAPGRARLRELVEWMRPAFFLVFLMGYFSAGFEWYERLLGYATGWKNGLKCSIGLAICAAVFIVRVALADSAAYATLDFLLVPLFVPGVLLAAGVSGPVFQCLRWLGRISVYLWLTHLYVFEVTEGILLRVFHSHFLFFLAETLLCILVAFGCYALERLVRQFLFKRPIS